ncbi:MAG TPA: hypothetical protein VF796_14320 [Humisphaera sp.]
MSTRRLEDNPWLGWFKLAIWVGILANLAFALPAFFAPDAALKLFRLPYYRETIWIRDAGGLLTFLSLMYVGAARDPFRYRLTAALAVLGRIAFAVFWWFQILYNDLTYAFVGFAIGDTLIGVLQGVLYVLMMRHEYLQPALPTAADAEAERRRAELVGAAR